MEPLNVTSASGSYLQVNGRSILDASSGALNVNVGHAHPRVMDVFRNLSPADPYVLRGAFTTEATEVLTILLQELYGEEYCAPIFGVTGSDSIEQALRVVMQYWRSRGETNRLLIAADSTSYHGMTRWALDSSGHPPRAIGSRGGLIEQSDTVFAGGWGTGRRASLDEWKSLLDAHKEMLAAVLYEPIGGASSGAQSLTAEEQDAFGRYAQSLGIPIIADEVMCGLGRVGTPSPGAERMRADIVVSSKGLGAGYYPISALMVRKSFGNHITSSGDAYGTFGHTMARQAIGARIAHAVLSTVQDDDLWTNVNHLGAYLLGELRKITSPLPGWSCTGEGFQVGIHYSSEDSAIRIESLKRSCFEKGVLFHDSGISPYFKSLLIGPPLNSSKSEIDKLLDVLGTSLAE